jgi:hypothetical protein
VQDNSYAKILLLNRFFFSEVIVRLRRRSAETWQKEVAIFPGKFLCGKCATRGKNFGNFCLSGNLSCGIYAVQDDSYAEILLLNRFFFSEVIVR